MFILLELDALCILFCSFLQLILAFRDNVVVVVASQTHRPPSIATSYSYLTVATIVCISECCEAYDGARVWIEIC